jgi:hypothetical protein
MAVTQDDKKIPLYLVLIFLSVLTIALFADVLFFSDNLILSKDGTDISHQFMYWRDFGFSQLKNGNLALWNPHIFSGAPFFGGFQSALLYPPNLLFLMLPLSKAINVSIVLHVVFIGFFMYLWTGARGLHPLAALFSSVLVMFSGPYFLHIYAGHLSNLCAMAWAPLILLCLDRIFERFSIGWLLMGVLAVTMLILAGHPQYVYYTAITCFIYTALCLLQSSRRVRTMMSLALICLGSFMISAVQIFSGFDAASESIRSSGLSYSFTKMFSFPPENILTLLTPYFFGDMVSMPYWGHCYLWEMSLFISMTGLALAVNGAFYGKSSTRRFSIVMILILLILALGGHVPLFKVLYQWLPGFSSFRGTSKFIFPLSIFLIMLAGIGLDELIRNKRQGYATVLIVFTIGIILAGCYFLMAFPSDGSVAWEFWKKMMQLMNETKESYLPDRLYRDANFIRESIVFSSKSFMAAAVTCLILSLLLFMARYFKISVYLIFLLGFLEIYMFAIHYTPAFDIRQASKVSDSVSRFIKKHPGDYRILNLPDHNSSMSIDAQDLWGYDPGVLLRYAQFMYFTQGLNQDQATQYLVFQKNHRLLKMLRCRYIFFAREGQITAEEIKDPMERIQLISHWRIMKQRDEIFKEMEKSSFDPEKTVILEESPDIKSFAGEIAGNCRIEDSSVNHLVIKGKLEHPALLLITDSYSRGWKAVPLKGSTQAAYQVMPANYTLMAIPLSAGVHHLRLEYLPGAFILGKWVSLISLTIFFAVFCFAAEKSSRFRQIIRLIRKQEKNIYGR